MPALNEQVIWVVGGGTGIGRATVVELASGGATVIVSGRRADALAETVKLAKAGDRVSAVPLDIADADAVARTVADLLKRHGRIDTMVLAAGVNVPERQWSKLSPADWNYVNTINASGLFYCLHALLPSMRARRAGLIINVGSWGGRYALKLSGPAYAASKRAMMAMNETLNLEEGDNGIRSCLIAPAGVGTDMLKQRAIPIPKEEFDILLQPEDLAKLVRFVAEQPQHVCMNEILLSPTQNYVYQKSA